MSLMPTLLIGICRVSAWACTSSMAEVRGFLDGAATFIWRFLMRDQGSDGADPAKCNDSRRGGSSRRTRAAPQRAPPQRESPRTMSSTSAVFGFVRVEIFHPGPAGFLQQNLDFLLGLLQGRLTVARQQDAPLEGLQGLLRSE